MTIALPDIPRTDIPRTDIPLTNIPRHAVAQKYYLQSQLLVVS